MLLVLRTANSGGVFRGMQVFFFAFRTKNAEYRMNVASDKKSLHFKAKIDAFHRRFLNIKHPKNIHQT
jgi:hypothetical protein